MNYTIKDLARDLRELRTPFAGMFDPVEDEFVEGIELPEDTRSDAQIAEEQADDEFRSKHLDA